MTCETGRLTFGVQFMSDPFRELVERMVRLSVPEDDTEENWERRKIAASESGPPALIGQT
jgi:hypothetical protein